MDKSINQYFGTASDRLIEKEREETLGERENLRNMFIMDMTKSTPRKTITNIYDIILAVNMYTAS